MVDVGFTVAVVVAGLLEQAPTVATTEYSPDAAVVAPVIKGLCDEDVNPFGPVHE